MGYLDKPETYQPSADALEFERKIREQRLKTIMKEEQENTTDLEEYYQDVAAYQAFVRTPDYRKDIQQARDDTYSKLVLEQKAIRDTMTEVFREGDPTLTKEENKMIKEGRVPMPYFDQDEGEFVFGDAMSWYEAQDWSAWGKENELGLAGEELGAIYNVAQMYLGSTNLFDKPMEESPEFQAMFSEGMEEGQEAYRHYSLTSSNFGRLAFWKGEYVGETLFEHMPLANIRAAFPDDENTHYTATTPSKFYASRRHENWDGDKAYDIYKKYHPGIIAMMEQQGVTREELANTPNHFEFRNTVMETLHMGYVNQRLANISEEGAWYGNAGRFVGGFAINSLGSVDMVLEAAVAVGTWGASVGVTAGWQGLKVGARALHLTNRLEGAAKLADAAQFARRLRTAQDFSAKVTGVLPSSWGSTLVEGGTKKAFGSLRPGASFWDSAIGKRSLQTRGIDFAEGLVEGAMYSTINQVSHSENQWDWEAFWNETLSEGGGQVVAGPIFRGVFRSGSYGVHMLSQGTLNRVYNGLQLTDETRTAIGVAFQPVDEKWSTLTQTQKDQVMQAKILMGMAYTNWNEMTGETAGMGVVTQSVLAELGQTVGNELDIAGLVATVYASRPVDPETKEPVKLSPLEATIATVDAALNFIDRHTDKALSQDQENDLFRTIVIGSFAENQIKETGGDVRNESDWTTQLEALEAMDETQRTEILEQAVEAWRTVSKKMGLSTIRIRPDSTRKRGVEFETISNDALETLREMFPSVEIEELTSLDPETVEAIRDAVRGDRTGEGDALDVENSEAVIGPQPRTPDDPIFEITTIDAESTSILPPTPTLPVNFRQPDSSKPFEAEPAVPTVEEMPGSPAIETVVEDSPVTGDIDSAAALEAEVESAGFPPTDTTPAEIINSLKEEGIDMEYIDDLMRGEPPCP